MQADNVVCGYLDVKISARTRRGFTPWKAWQRQWCELKKLDHIENGVELKLKSSSEGSILSSLVLSRSSTICRTESRTKQYAFGVFTVGRNQKPILFLAGSSENDSQEWISSIRRMLCVASYLPVGESNFHVSLVDNLHSRAAGLFGLHGVLGTNNQEIVISDPCTGEPKISWKWYQFHQFHLQASSQLVDDKKIVVMHTSGEFSAGPGQIYFYCKHGRRLLNHLIGRGKNNEKNSKLKSTKRLSRSEGDLCSTVGSSTSASNSPVCLRSQTGSDDSGVRVSISSDDSTYLIKNKTSTSFTNGLAVLLLIKTPGGSETNGSVEELAQDEKASLPRRESGVSLASGIYEEISEDHVISHVNHIYENPLDLLKKTPKPPPLPPRVHTPYKFRCNTLPAKDLSRISQIFTSDRDTDYEELTSPVKTDKTKEKSKISAIAESLYLPMSPVIQLKNKIENYYVTMNAKK